MHQFSSSRPKDSTPLELEIHKRNFSQIECTIVDHINNYLQTTCGAELLTTENKETHR